MAAVDYEAITKTEEALDRLRQEFPDAGDVIGALDIDPDSLAQYTFERDPTGGVAVAFITGFVLGSGRGEDEIAEAARAFQADANEAPAAA